MNIQKMVIYWEFLLGVSSDNTEQELFARYMGGLHYTSQIMQR